MGLCLYTDEVTPRLPKKIQEFCYKHEVQVLRNPQQILVLYAFGSHSEPGVCRAAECSEAVCPPRGKILIEDSCEHVNEFSVSVKVGCKIRRIPQHTR